MTEDKKLTIEQFNELRDLAFKNRSTTYCFKLRARMFLDRLEAEICLNCNEFILNEGDCDPL